MIASEVAAFAVHGVPCGTVSRQALDSGAALSTSFGLTLAGKSQYSRRSGLIFESIRMIDSMFIQHAKWLKVAGELAWRRPIASLNYLLNSNVWQQDHNGFTHQDPGFFDHVIKKKASVVRVYLPPDATCLLSNDSNVPRFRQ